MRLVKVLLFLISMAFMSAISSAQVLFRDEFSGSTLSSSWRTGTWDLGRTRLGLTPSVADGIATLAHHTYNPNFPGTKFLGTEIYTAQSFARGNGLEIEARLRTNVMPSGLITALFTHTFVGNLADEIDFEFLTKQINSSTSLGQKILTTQWNDWDPAVHSQGDGIHHWDSNPTIAGLQVANFNTFTIRWLPTKTEWLVNGTVVVSSDKALPDAPMPVRLDIWAATSGWTNAYSSAYQPTAIAMNNHVSRFDVDYVEVRAVPEPSAVLGLAATTIFLGIFRRRTAG